MKPVLAVSILTYNHEKYIGLTIERIVNQKTEYSYKLFITDDNSTDNTVGVCRKYQEKYPELIDFEALEKNIGVIPNWIKNYQKCIASGAEFIANCDGDDYWTDEKKIQKQVTFLKNNTDYGLTFSDTKLVDFENNDIELTDYFIERKKMYKSGEIFWDLLKSNFVNNSSICLRTSCITNVFPLTRTEEKKKWYIVDYWLWLHIAMHNRVQFTSDVLAVYRTHPQNLTTGSSGFFSKRPPYIMLDVITALGNKRVSKEQRTLLAKILYSIIVKKKTSLLNKSKAMRLLVKYPPPTSLFF